MRSCSTMSVYVARNSLSTPSGVRPLLTAAPPTRKSSANSKSPKSGLLNHSRLTPALAKALHTRATGCSYVRSRTNVACVWLRSIVLVMSVLLRRGVQEVAEPVEPALGGKPLGSDPLTAGRQCFWGELVRAHATDLVRRDDPGVLEHLEVLHDRGQRHVEWTSQLADRRRGAHQAFDHGAPAAVGESVEHPVESIRILKHMLKYCRLRGIVNPHAYSRSVQLPAGSISGHGAGKPVR